MADSIVVGKRGVVTLPAEIRRRHAIGEGTVMLLEEQSDGILLRQAVSVPIEIYSDERIGEFLGEDAPLEKRAGARKKARPQGGRKR